MLANVKIEQDKDNKYIHRVFVDGKQIEKITHLDFQINATRFTSRIDCIYIRAASFVIAHILQHAFFVLLFIF